MIVQRFIHRLDTLSIVVVVIFIALISRLGYLQVVQGKYYERLADGNRIKMIPIHAPRGIFYDRNGVALVSNRPGFTVSIVSTNKEVPDTIIDKLAELLEMDRQEIVAKLKRRQDSYEPVPIKIDVGQDVVAKIEERRGELPGVVVEIQSVRNYLNKEYAAHLFGYVSEIDDLELARLKAIKYKQSDLIGKFGLEKVYDQDLRGVDGGGQVEVDVNGRPVQVLGKQEPVPGNNLVLTIDWRIQTAAETTIDEHLRWLQTAYKKPNAKAAAAVVMNPKTGAVLAMVSRPAFDPNLFAVGISTQDWKALSENPFHPMTNRAIAGEYPPGSLYKIVTSTAALELEKVTPEEKILDKGTHWLIPKSNSQGEALGWINFHTALSMSDNVYFYEMGNRLGIDALEKYSRMFGLGEVTGINLPGESEGLVANQRYKQQVYGESWYLSETFDAAIGQGFQLATPLQMASLVSQIANGGHRYRPYLVSRMTSPDGKVIKAFEPEEMGRIKITDKNLNIIRQALHEVSRTGTAAYIFGDFPLSLAGKTGTAENSHGMDHGWFAAYAPFEDPGLVVVVIVEQGGFGSVSAAPIAKRIMEAAFNLTQNLDYVPRVYGPHTAL
ncbi:penicillin-binding protein 2 [Acetonema longum]|uniref:Penicillin-binding protein 2 n=1 Tax=Acetonema longum DSM 6540 TaxID=1009370 RepID=F7NHP1_9FIRM|nr:penicillin-binding protein 2 [Acetonema longum]EGO64416.1 penicillin-binding protein 2 [Acetonema longum DSM 6540]